MAKESDYIATVSTFKAGEVHKLFGTNFNQSILLKVYSESSCHRDGIEIHTKKAFTLLSEG